MLREETKEILKLADQGKTVTEIHSLTGISKKKIYNRINKYRGRIVNRVYVNYDDEIKRMISEGSTYVEIAKALGRSRRSIYNRCKKLGLLYDAQGMRQSKDEERFASKLNGARLGIRYVSGYTGGDTPVNVQCDTCGAIFSWNAENLRKAIRNGTKKIPCQNCKDIKRQKEREAQLVKQHQACFDKARKRMYGYINRREQTAVCRYCGAVYRKRFGFGNKQKIYCSEECFIAMKESTKRANRCDLRLKKCPKRVWNITVQRLYKRDGGVCWICGEQTDLADKVIRTDGTVICGERYPSIDHVVPISKGGNHTWDNVKLAHRGCNAIRGAN